MSADRESLSVAAPHSFKGRLDHWCWHLYPPGTQLRAVLSPSARRASPASNAGPHLFRGRASLPDCRPAFAASLARWEADHSVFAGLHRLEQLHALLLYAGAAATPACGKGSTRQLAIGLVLGVGAEWLLQWEGHGLEYGRKPDWQPPRLGDSVVEQTGRALNLTGPSMSVSAACASGNVALAQARAWLRLGWSRMSAWPASCDMAVSTDVAGRASATCAAFVAVCWHGDPPAASRPFDKGRDGFVMSEGGAVFVLERSERVRQRSAPRVRRGRRVWRLPAMPFTW